MRCPQCSEKETIVYRTANKAKGTTRYRKCKSCGHNFKTIETVCQLDKTEKEL